jgi:hypothetical protein
MFLRALQHLNIILFVQEDIKSAQTNKIVCRYSQISFTNRKNHIFTPCSSSWLGQTLFSKLKYKFLSPVCSYSIIDYTKKIV